MVADYARFESDESYLRTTEEIVVGRARKQLEFARRRLELARMEAEKTTEHELEQKRRSLAFELEGKRLALRQAEQADANQRFEAENEARAKAHDVAAAQHALEVARRELAQHDKKAGKKAGKSDAKKATP